MQYFAVFKSLFSNQSVLYRNEVQVILISLFEYKIRKVQGTYSQVVRFLTLLHSVFVYVIPCTAQELL
jgi:hypothetical protein